MAEQRPHFSVSQIKTYQRCAKRWEFKYVQRIPEGKGPPAIRGLALHAGAAHNFRQKIETRRDLRLSEVLDVAAQEVEGQFAGGVYLTAAEQTVGVSHLRARTKDIAVAMTRHYHLRVAPKIQPVLVEETIRVRPGGKLLKRDVLGRLDLYTRDDRLIDNKSSEREPREGEEHREQGLTMYALLFHARYGRLPREVGLEYVSGRTPVSVHHSYRASTRTMADLRAMVQKLVHTERAIDAGAFPPTSPDNWWCSERWCSYWNICPFGGRGRS